MLKCKQSKNGLKKCPLIQQTNYVIQFKMNAQRQQDDFASLNAPIDKLKTFSLKSNKIKFIQPWHRVSVSAKKPGYFCSSQ